MLSLYLTSIVILLVSLFFKVDKKKSKDKYAIIKFLKLCDRFLPLNLYFYYLNLPTAHK